MKRSLQSGLLAAVLFAAPVFAGPAVVGVATAIGSFNVNSSAVTGTTNVTDGAVLKTTRTISQVKLKGGSDVVLGTNSAATIYANKIVLQQGFARLDNLKPSFNLETSSLRVENDQVGGQGAVRVNGNKVEVASVVGDMNVYNKGGVLLTKVAAGTVVAVDDDPQSGASSGGPTPSGAGGAPPIMSNAAAAWVAAGLAAVGLGVGLGLAESGGGSSSP